MSSYSYEQNMETEKLMQNNDGTLNANQTMNNCVGEQKVGGCVDDGGVGNGGVGSGGEVSCEKGINGDTKPELIEMSTSTHSVKCCNGFLKTKKKSKIVKDMPSQVPPQANGCGNGTTPMQQQQQSNGKCYFNTLKAKLSSSNGKYQVNGDVECGNGGVEKCKKAAKTKADKTCVFDDRDPFKINSNVKFEFQNVFAEPNSGTYSFNPTWSFTSKMYFNVKLFLYRLFAIIIGIPCALVCAVIFAIFSVVQIWLFMPVLRMFKAIFGIIKEVWSVVIDTVFGPVFQLFTVCVRPSAGGYRVSSDSQCPSSASSKSIYNEDVNVV